LIGKQLARAGPFDSDKALMKSNLRTATLSAFLIGGCLAFQVSAPANAVESNDIADENDYIIVDSNSLLGSYLAGRLARSQRDNDTAADYYRQALDKDPDSNEILEEAFQLRIATGQFDEARKLAHELSGRTGEHKVASFFLGIEALQQKRHDEADKLFQAGGSGPIADLTARLARAWIAFDRGRTKTALKMTGQTNSARTEGAQQIEMLHRAMIADLSKQRKTAEALYKQLSKSNPRNLRIAVGYARHAAFWGDKPTAMKLLEPHLAGTHPNPLVKEVADEIAGGGKVSLSITNSMEGMAAVFQGVGEALTGDGVIDAGQIYLQLALFSKPDTPLAHYALGELYDQIGKHEAAAASFARIPKNSPLWLNAQLGKAYALNALEKYDEAKGLLKELVAAYPDDTRPYSTLGTILRANKEYAEAVTYYTKAIETLGPEKPSHWSAYYSRGVCYERLKDWTKAETDLKKALALDPEQELTLNYLGYSWVDQDLRIEEAMQLIRRAVDKRPNDGYFVDSLGWAHYRQSDFDEAVKHLERAVELKPDDPVINDHLGDAYWKVGRRLEASYQWKQALGLQPEPEDEAKIREKIDKGLIDPPSTRAAMDSKATQPANKTE
jgi:tetratricopeptide (TPR) repeat protein